MLITIINDCRDQNALSRQAIRTAALVGHPVHAIGVTSDIEASGNLVDMLDASEDKPAVVLVNVAPRNGKAKKWPNGTPFGYFRLQNALIITTIDGHSLSLVKKLNLVEDLHIVDVPEVIDYAVSEKLLPQELHDRIIISQFRSYDFMPRLAQWLTENIAIPSQPHDLKEVPELTHMVWWVDSFGNCKTTVLPEDIAFEPGKTLETKIGSLSCYSRLKDVPNDQPGIVVGSSGYGANRFLEIVIQGKSAANHFSLQSGSKIL